jgi:DNA helicase II / ATP-dependent DNA helicase PcrA
VDSETILTGLNDEQRQAAEAVQGPVCVVAGAGTGKTTTITRRIANQVAGGAFAGSEILAVTFTDKAAGEMRSRLVALGVPGIAARTFHSAALAQLRYFRPGDWRVLPSKVLVLREIANTLPGAYRYRPAADLAAEVEWARNRRLTPETYQEGLGARRPPLPPDLMERVLRRYERRKRQLELVDFEDLLELAIRLFDEDEHAAGEFRARYRAFTVDEYQDVNLLQQALLERWLGGRQELCVVGDDHQAIYSFTGATPRYLLEMPRRFPGAAVFRLEQNYRSTPQILELANRLAPKLGGFAKVLETTRPPGPTPAIRVFRDRHEEVAALVGALRNLASERVPWKEIAVLYRTNARSEDFEEALTAAGIPFQVRGGSFLDRQAARRVMAGLSGSTSTAVAAEVREVADRLGYVETPPAGLGEHEATRQADLARLVGLAADADDGNTITATFLAGLRDRFGEGGEERGVHLLTYHRAKGLEFDAVFLPLLEERELPTRQAARDEELLAEERRLLYVGITRARTYLFLSRSAAAKGSRFLVELRPATSSVDGRLEDEQSASVDPLFVALRSWRRDRARTDGIPPYVVFHDRTLAEIARRRPRSPEELAAVAGVGPTKLERYAKEVLAALAGGGS